MKLFEPITIRGMQLKNRVVMAPMATNLGYTNPVARAYYTERARGGVAAIILGGTQVDSFSSTRFLDTVRERLVEPVHQLGAKIGPQLMHQNLFPTLPVKDQYQVWIAPSAGQPWSMRPIVPLMGDVECYSREATVSEIQTMVERFAMAAAGAKKAGFDFVEVHSAHGNNIVSQFLSPLYNRRTDIYGGDLQGRMRFGLEIARAIRKAVGDDYPVMFRITTDELFPGGVAREDVITYAVELEKFGVDVMDVDAGSEYSDEAVRPRPLGIFPAGDEPEGLFVPEAEAVKRRVFVPVIGVGGFHSPAAAEAVLRQGKADLIAIGRQLIADPHWVEKAAAGREEDIVPCLQCNNCLYTFLSNQPMRCSVNAFFGKDEQPVTRAQQSKKVFVIGGGVGGMEAARVAALRGHKVTLFEKEDKLGGQLLAAEVATKKQRIGALLGYLALQLKKTGVQVRLGVEFDNKALDKEKPDAVIVATGAKPFTPEIPGINRDNVANAIDVLQGRVSVRGQKVVVLGGGMVGCETAEFLAEQGNQVIIVEMLPRIADDMPEEDRVSILYRLGAQGIIRLTGTKAESVTDEGLVVKRKAGSQTIKADKIVVAAGSRSDSRLAEELSGKLPVFKVGDCVQPRRIPQAVGEGAQAALDL